MAANGAVITDNSFQTNIPSVYAIGDVIHRHQLTPVAIAEGAALARTLYGNQPIEVDYTNIATCVFSQPSLAMVGLTEEQAKIPIQRLDSPDLPRGTETVLLVEDDSALRKMAATLLRRLGYTVLAAANGIEALDLKQKSDTGHIDLLFTDVVMPHMSGKELADRVKALYPHTRILFTSAYTENAIVHQGVLDKGVALLQKPFTPSALAHKLREVLDEMKMG